MAASQSNIGTSIPGNNRDWGHGRGGSDGGGEEESGSNGFNQPEAMRSGVPN